MNRILDTKVLWKNICLFWGQIKRRVALPALTKFPVKPILHQNANAFAWGSRIGLNPQTLAFPVGDTNRFLSKALITLGVFKVVLGQKTPNSLRWVHLIVI